MVDVALLTESVDWNLIIGAKVALQQVALLTESVDWNTVSAETKRSDSTGRSPRGERGLKCVPVLSKRKT